MNYTLKGRDTRIARRSLYFPSDNLGIVFQVPRRQLCRDVTLRGKFTFGIHWRTLSGAARTGTEGEKFIIYVRTSAG